MVSARSKCVCPLLSVRRTNRSRPVTARRHLLFPARLPPGSGALRRASASLGAARRAVVDSLIRVACQVSGGNQSRTGSWLEVTVLIAGFPAGAFAANCYVVEPGPDAECLIIDPGQEAEPGIEEILGRFRLHPVAVLATHGHVDHIWSIAPVCDAADIPAYIHPADRALLTDPGRGISAMAGRSLFGGITFREPADVLELADGMTLELAGIRLTVDHAPGHTPGSVTFRLPGEPQAGTLFTGDLLFAGSIGRT